MSNKHNKHRLSLKPREDWRGRESWRLFRINSEFVDGFETMMNAGPSVTIFGSSRAKPGSEHYELGVEVAKKIAEKGFAVITGGGGGLMEASNLGAQKGNGVSCGLCIDLPNEPPNEYIDYEYKVAFHYFFVRKVMFVRYAQAFIVLPGGLGTLDELFEAMTLVQTHKVRPFPIFLMGKDYWKDMIEWLKNTAVKHGYISEEDLNLMTVTDDANEVANAIDISFNKEHSIRNF